eukprot:7491347-Alexandrium_andersonii.AAC.1
MRAPSQAKPFRRGSRWDRLVADHDFTIGPDHTILSSDGSRAVGRGRCLLAGARRPRSADHSGQLGVGSC